MQNECRLSVITVNYNGLRDTCALIDSITFTNDMEVIVVDNASRSDEASLIATRYPQVRVIRSPQNLGFAGGNNLGIQAARGKYLFFINNDTEFKGNWLQVEQLIRRLETSPTIGLVCPKIRFAWNDSPIQFAGYTPLSSVTMRNRAIGFGESDLGQYDTPHPTPYAHGAAMMARRETITSVGLMPEDYFLYYEELDWSMMFRRSGSEIWYDPACTIYHKESQATGQDSPLKAYYITRNRLLFVRRNVGSPVRYASYTYLVCVVALRDILKNLIKGRPDLVKATLRGISNFLKS